MWQAGPSRNRFAVLDFFGDGIQNRKALKGVGQSTPIGTISRIQVEVLVP